jgi:peptidoglycan/LPS O-acetylase OafA/YrhL
MVYLALGGCSLAIYIFHSVIIGILIRPREIQVPLLLFFGACLLLIAGMIIAAYLLPVCPAKSEEPLVRGPGSQWRVKEKLLKKRVKC